MFPTAKAEIIVGSSTVATITSLSWASDIIPIISEIGVIAGSIVAVHGVCKIGYGYYKLWKYRQKDNH